MPCVEDCYKQDGNTGCLKMKTIATGKKTISTMLKNKPAYQVRQVVCLINS